MDNTKHLKDRKSTPKKKLADAFAKSEERKMGVGSVTMPIIRDKKVVVRNNKFIPDSRLPGEEEDRQDEGRVIAIDVTILGSPVLKSARIAQKHRSPIGSVEDTPIGVDDLTKEFEKKCSTSMSTAKIEKTITVQSKDEDDSAYTKSESEESDDEDSVMSSEYIDKNELDISLNSGTEDEHKSDSSNDPFSPEHAKGTYYYNVPDYESGTVHNIRRSSRNSFGSPVGKELLGTNE